MSSDEITSVDLAERYREFEDRVDVTFHEGVLKWTCQHCDHRQVTPDVWDAFSLSDDVLYEYCDECGREQSFAIVWRDPEFVPAMKGVVK